MSKADGQYIAIRFTEALTGDSSGLTPSPVGGTEERVAEISNIIGSSQYSTYAPERFIDSDTSTYWRPSSVSGQYAVFTLTQQQAVIRFRIYVGNTTYRPNTFTLSGSNDGETYTVVYSGTCTSTSGWQEFDFANDDKYKYYRFDITAANSSRLYMFEAELVYTYAGGNEIAFTVTGQEYDMEPEGTLYTQSYDVISVEAYPEDEYAILLSILPLDRFHRVQGDLTVTYDSTLGNLAGYGGPVASFTVPFTPKDLVNKPHPHDPERIELASLAVTGTLIHIYYSDLNEAYEHIEITNISAAGVLTHIDDL